MYGGAAPGRAAVPTGQPYGAAQPGGGQPPAGRRNGSRTGILVAVAVVVVLLLGGGAFAVNQLTGDDSKSGASQDPTDSGRDETTDGATDGGDTGDSGGSTDGGARPEADFHLDDADWTTTAETHNNDTGKTVAYKCPAKGEAHTVYGSEPFTSDSSVCTAAVFAGWISMADGGWVKIQMQPGVESYQGSSNYGVVTREWGAYEWAFSFSG
jgi:hypothetical protein